MTDDLLSYLSEFLTPRRFNLIKQVSENRTRYITIVLEDIFQSQNASAVLRSCECLGIQDVHIIENTHKYTFNRDIVLGANKWLSLYRYKKKDENTQDAIKALKAKGYRIIATCPNKDDINLDNLDLQKGKLAVFFGTERRGLSETVLRQADEYIKIPMHGFTESFNISVAAAITLHHLTYKLHAAKDIDWHLSDAEKSELVLDWMKKSIKNSDEILKRFYKQNVDNEPKPLLER
jgi:tRNA (guanosine-2'-O-)-methyltransferase